MTSEWSSGQTALELIIAFGILVLVFAIVILISMEKTAESARIKSYLDARRIAGSIKDNVNMISQQGPGYYSHFSMPLSLHGGFEYDVQIRGSILELMWGERTWSTKLMASNVTVHCLTKGLNARNRIYYGENGVGIKCHLPNLLASKDNILVEAATVSIEVLNDAHVASPSFTTSYTDNETQMNISVSGLAADESVTLMFNTTAKEFIIIYVDFTDAVNESIETDNNYTVYL